MTVVALVGIPLTIAIESVPNVSSASWSGFPVDYTVIDTKTVSLTPTETGFYNCSVTAGGTGVDVVVITFDLSVVAPPAGYTPSVGI